MSPFGYVVLDPQGYPPCPAGCRIQDRMYGPFGIGSFVMSPARGSMHTILDLKQFPLDQPDSAAYDALVKRCRTDLARDGMFNLTGFLRPEVAAETTAMLAPRFASDSFEHARTHNVYFEDRLDDLPPDHPAQTKVVTSNHTLCADQASDTALASLYSWAPLREFLAQCLELSCLYPMDDALACWNAMQYQQGQGLNWHFDRSEFTTTLLLQAPDAGGVFEYRSNLRSQSDPNYDGVGRLMTGKDPKVKQLALTPGTLNVFRGKNTAHRVTPVEGNTDRMIAVFTYYKTDGMRFTDEENIGFYGRAS